MKSLIYKSPAASFNEATPLGNGHMGAMVFGAPCEETIQLNADTFWSGRPLKPHYDATEKLPIIRQLIDENRISEAESYLNENMLNHWTQNYLPVGNLKVTVSDHYQAAKYSRSLDLEKGILSVDYNLGATHYRREIFCSFPDNVLVIRFTSDAKNKLTLGIAMEAQVKSITQCEDGYLSMVSRAPSHTDPVYDYSDAPTRYEDSHNLYACTTITPVTDGEVYSRDGQLIIKSANEVTLLLSCQTNFVNYATVPSSLENLKEKVNTTLQAAKNKAYDELLDNHTADYTTLFSPTAIRLSKEDSIEPLVHLEAAKKGTVNPALVEALFDFGRYLTISSSRAGSQPTNLQGIWNNLLHPPWCSNYTININTEMNYWPVDVTNLSPCFTPLLDMIKDLSQQGKQSAESLGCDGWTAHHNTDLWRQCTPVSGNGQYAFWPFGGPWLATHLMEHYRFTQDRAYLSDVLPLIKSSCDFCTSWIYKEEDHYVTSPATSPENQYLDSEGKNHWLSKATTMDLSIVWQIIEDYIEASAVLDMSLDDYDDLRLIQKELQPYAISTDGTLQEWLFDFDDRDEGHRHLSHLFGIYPGTRINSDEDDDLVEAALNSLAKRAKGGSGHTSWSCAWFILLYARLHKGNNAEAFVNKFCQHSLIPNLFSSHPPFQIDGNFGLTAGIAEMLLQSHNGYIELLPALPDSWTEGSYKGLKARGNLLLSVTWDNNKVKFVEITAMEDGVHTFKINGALHKLTCKEEKNVFEINDNCIVSTI